MFGRNKTQTEAPAQDPLHPQREGAKNRPTPKRRDQEAARRQPLVVTDRKRAKELDRQRRREAYAKQREAMVTGDERGLPPRDKGPVRRYVRDYIDSRFNVSEVLLPVMLLVMAMMFFRVAWVVNLAFILVYGAMVVAMVDLFLLWRRLKKRLVEKFGADALPRGLAMYAVTRAFQVRRLRLPKPQVKRGQTPA